MPDLAADGPIPESTPEAAAPALAALPASFGEYAKDVVGESSEMLASAAKIAPYSQSLWARFARGVGAAGAAEAGLGPTDTGIAPDLSPSPSPMMSKAEATARHPDVAKQSPDLFSDNMPEGVVDALADADRLRIEREGVFGRFEAAHSWYTNFPARTALTMLDPVNAAAMLVPGIGEEAVLARLGTGLVPRTAARLVAGATAAGAGMAPGIGLRYALSQAEGGDYGIRSAFADLASGVAFGALIHGGIGGLREFGILSPDHVMRQEPAPTKMPKPSGPGPTVPDQDQGEPPPEQTAEGPAVAANEPAAIPAASPLAATPEERASLQAMLDRKATPEELNAHPIIQRALDAARNKTPTTDLPDYGSDEFKANREFNFNGEKVVGYDAAIDRLTDQARAYSTDKPVGQNRQAVLVFGPPAAGKSRLVEGIARERGMAIPDPDDAKRVIPEYDGGTGAGAVHEESTVLASQVTKRLVDNGNDIAIPMIGRTLGKARRLAESLKARGYDVDLINLTVDPAEAYRRAVGRFMKTGRISSWEYLSGVGKAPRDNYYQLKQEGLIREGIDVDGNRGPQEEPHFLDGGDTSLAEVFRSGRSVAGQPGGRAGAAPGTSAEIQSVVNADAATRYDATRAAVAQVLDGRPVEVRPVITPPAGSQAIAAFAEQQIDLHRQGYQPSMTQAELVAATEELYDRPESAAAGTEPGDGNTISGIPRETPSPATNPARENGPTGAAAAHAVEHARAVPAEARAASATGVPGETRPGEVAPIPSDIPNGVTSFSPGQLGVDPERFQFKAGGDESGVTERLKGVKTWDPIKAGMALVWVDKDGKPWIVDGHQRVALAKRIASEDPAQNPQVLSRTLKETDGITPEMARAVAAMKNIAEGTGTSVDAAKVIRNHPELAGDLPPRSELVRQARGLVNLDTDAFRMVVNDVVPPNYAAIVGRLVPEDGKMQSALLSLLSKTDPANATQAEAIVRQGIQAGTHVETQASLFGDQEVASSLYLERAKVLDRALKQLRRDKAVFSTLVKESDILEEAGNKLAKDINEKRATADAQALQILQILANRTGSISDSLGDAARRAKSDGSLAGAVRDFVASVRKSAASGDLTRLANGVDRGPVHAGDESPASRVERSIGGPVKPAEEAAATAEVERAIQRPTAEPGAEGKPQLVLPGAEQSARQAAAARTAQGPGIRSSVPQEEAGGLFGPKTEAEPSLFGPYEVKTPDLDRDVAVAQKEIADLALTPEDHAEIAAATQELDMAGLTEQAYAQAAECLAGSFS